jgi:hypothetical protein
MAEIASNWAMSNPLEARLTQLLAKSLEQEIAKGLSPLATRLARQFGQGDEGKLERQLLPFCQEYILLVPTLVTSLESIGREFRLISLLETYLSLATQYIDSACDEIEINSESVSLEQFLILLQGAYIFCRMVEELDDKAQSFIGIPLNNINLMDANLIVHEIIGDSFANRLDKVVTSLVKQSSVSKSVIEANLNRDAINASKSSHSNLTGRPVENFAEKHGLDLLSGLT